MQWSLRNRGTAGSLGLAVAYEEAETYLTSLPPGIRGGPARANNLLRKTCGTQIGPYKLLQKIGEGGMGVVYMAEQPSRSSAGWP